MAVATAKVPLNISKMIPKAGSGAPNLQAPQFARQSSNFTSGNPGSSTSASNKGKSTNFSKASNSDNWSLSSITGASSHYGGAMPSQQAPPMDDTFVPSQVGTDSMNWFGENWQSNDGSLQSMVNPKNPNLFKRALGFMSSLGGASPQEPQFSPSIHDTAAASSYYPSNQPDDGSLQTMFTPRNPSSMPYQQAPPMQDTFVPSQTGTHSTNFFGWNSQNNDGDLDSMIRPKNTSSSGGFYGTPFLPNQSQSTGWPGASNYFSPTPNTSNFTSGNPGSSAIPFQQAPMPGTSFPSFPNQSAQLNSSTNFGPSQNETNWSGGNSQNNEGDLYSMKAGGGSRKSAFERFKDDPRAMDLVEQFQNNEISNKTELLTKLNEIGLKIGATSLNEYLKKIEKAGGTPFLQAPQIAGQSSNFTSGNPGSSTSALKKGKSTNFMKYHLPGSESHYGDAMPYHQAPMHDDTFLPSQVGTDSTDWIGENLQSNDGSLQSMVNPKNPSLFESAMGSVSSWFGASPQEPQFSPSMHDTPAASSYYPSNQPDDQTLESMVTSRNPSSMPYQQAPPMQDTFVPSQAGTHSTNWFGENLQSNDGDLASMIRKPSSSEGFYGTPFLPNQSQSTGWTGASNLFSPTPNTSNFTSGNPGSSAIPFQQAPMTGTSFPSFSNQSAQLNSSTNFGPSQPGTPSWDWSGENSQNSEGDLYSMFNTRRSSSSKAQSMKLYAVVLIVVAILALSAICEAGKHRENLNSIATNINNTRRIEALTAALRAQTEAGGGTPNFQAPQITQRSTNFTSGNPGSSTSASEKGKSTNFSKKNSGNWAPLSSITAQKVKFFGRRVRLGAGYVWAPGTFGRRVRLGAGNVWAPGTFGRRVRLGAGYVWALTFGRRVRLGAHFGRRVLLGAGYVWAPGTFGRSRLGAGYVWALTFGRRVRLGAGYVWALTFGRRVRLGAGYVWALTFGRRVRLGAGYVWALTFGRRVRLGAHVWAPGTFGRSRLGAGYVPALTFGRRVRLGAGYGRRVRLGAHVWAPGTFGRSRLGAGYVWAPGTFGRRVRLGAHFGRRVLLGAGYVWAPGTFGRSRLGAVYVWALTFGRRVRLGAHVWAPGTFGRRVRLGAGYVWALTFGRRVRLGAHVWAPGTFGRRVRLGAHVWAPGTFGRSRLGAGYVWALTFGRRARLGAHVWAPCTFGRSRLGAGYVWALTFGRRVRLGAHVWAPGTFGRSRLGAGYVWALTFGRRVRLGAGYVWAPGTFGRSLWAPGTFGRSRLGAGYVWAPGTFGRRAIAVHYPKLLLVLVLEG
ncbi:hypothetical protein GPALN_005895 [Globodera pallida]|nr:hypothetical protein GPALN_005895 [Globodera pallida]